MYKMKVFVCFCEVFGQFDVFIVWFELQYYIVDWVVLFFVCCFIGMCWVILIFLCSVVWDGQVFVFGFGVWCEDVLVEDVCELLWQIYYVSIFNLVWFNMWMMMQEMLVKYWCYLFEVQLLLCLVCDVVDCVQEMYDWLVQVL